MRHVGAKTRTFFVDSLPLRSAATGPKACLAFNSPESNSFLDALLASDYIFCRFYLDLEDILQFDSDELLVFNQQERFLMFLNCLNSNTPTGTPLVGLA